MEAESNMGVCKTILVSEISKMVQLLKADLQEPQIDYMVNYIIKHYYSYTISDITTLTDRLVKNNPYGKPILQNLIYELVQYSVDKQEFAVLERVKENSQHKLIISKPDKFNKMYSRLKKEAKEPVISQKEKDQIAIKENEKKIDQLVKMYPKTH